MERVEAETSDGIAGVDVSHEIGVDFFDRAPELFCLMRRGGYIVRVNAAWQEALGWTPEELNGRSFYDIADPNDAMEAGEASAILDMGWPIRDRTCRVKTRWGAWRRLEWSAYRTQHNLTICCFRDVTDIRADQQRLVDEAKLRRLAEEAAGFGHWSVARSSETVWWSDGVYRIFGAEPGAFTVERDAGLAFYVEEDRPRIGALLAAAMNEAKPFTDVFRIRRADGALRWVRVSAFASDDGSPEDRRLVGVIADVTEQQTELERAREVETWLTRLVRDTPVATAQLSRDLTIVRASERFRTTFAPEQEAIEGLKLTDLFEPSEDFAAGIAMALGGEVAHGERSHALTARGSIPLWWAASPLRGSDGATTGVILTARDITELVRTTEAVERRERQLQRAVRLGRLVVWEADVATRNFDVLGDLDSVIDFDLGAAVLDNTLPQSVHAADRPWVLQNWRDYLTHRRPFESEHRIVRQDGRVVWINTSTEADFDAAGRPTKIFGVFRDITAFRELHARHALMAHALEHTEVGVSITANQPGMPVVHVNAGYERMTGYAAADVVGKAAGHLVGPETSDEAVQRVRAAVRENRSEAVDVLSYRKDGSTFWNAIRIAPFRDPNTGEDFWVSIEHDITKFVEAERRADDARREAEAASRAKSAFLANLSHEIRTPLNGLLGLLQAAMHRGLAPEQKALLQNALAAGDALTDLLGDLLDVARIEAGALELDMRRCDLTTLAASVTAAFTTLAASKGLELVLEADGPQPVLADPKRVRQALFNLVSNAIKFSDRGRIRVMLARTAEGAIAARVVDEGPGVAAGSVDRLFQRFSQLDDSFTRRSGGMGLGLAITKDLVTLMGGEIGYEPAPGGGACFWFTLQAAGAVEADAQKSRSETARLENKRVLVVEDKPTNQRVAGALLGALGAEAVFANDGVDGVAAAEAEPFDLIYMDIQMPRMDGLEAAARIRSGRGPNAATPILAVTANVSPHQIAHYRACGLDGVVAKPIKLDELLEASLLALARAAPEPARRAS